MKKIMLGLLMFVVLGSAGYLNTVVTGNLEPGSAVIEQVYPQTLSEPFTCIYKGVSTNPPWLEFNPPWDPNVGIPDFSNRNDEWLSMAVDINGRIYVCYQTPWTATNYGWGVATSTDQGVTWDNRIYYINNTTYTLIQPDIAITDNGKIYIWGVLNGGSYVNAPAYSRSSMTCYNNPDSIIGVRVYSTLPSRFAPECVTLGNGNQLVVTQYTADRGVPYGDSVQILFSHDTVSFYSLRFRPPGGSLGWTSVAINVLGGDTMLTHAVELIDSTNLDWDVYWYLDTMGIWSLWGTTTGNTFNDRYPSVYGTQNYTYLAFQSDDGTGNNEIVFDFANNYGGGWDPTLQNISNDGAPDLFPRVHGFSTSVGLAWNHGYTQVLYDYSVNNGQSGTWTGIPEIVTDAATADTGYHCVALLYTPMYFHAAWEDSRLIVTDSIDIWTSRRTTPVAVLEKPSTSNFALLKAYPNPFKDAVVISCGTLQGLRNARLMIFDPSGRLIRSLTIASHRDVVNAIWDGKDETGQQTDAGIYFCRLTANGISKTEKLIKLK